MTEDDDTESLAEWLAEFEEEHGDVIAVVMFTPDKPYSSSGATEYVQRDDERLTVRFDAGFGGTDAANVYAWSDTHVFVLGEYDGSEWWQAVPRNPTLDCTPGHIGGG